MENSKILSDISEDIFLLNGLNELVNIYQDKRGELSNEARDITEYYIATNLDLLAKNLKNNIDKVI